MINLYDGLNWVRIQSQEDRTGRYPRKLLNEMSTTRNVHIWVWDGAGSKEKRQQRFPGYKAKRVPEGEEFWTFINMCRKVLGHTHAIQVTVPGYEADDVIATLARRYDGRDTVHIHSTDRDFTQLCSGRIRTTAQPKAGVDPSRVRLYKTLVGDPSDNIPGLRGFGVKSWDGLSDQNRDELERAVQGHPFDRDRTGLSDRQLEQLDDLKLYWDIVGFFDVSIDLINKHTHIGDRDFNAGDAYLRQFMQ